MQPKLVAPQMAHAQEMGFVFQFQQDQTLDQLNTYADALLNFLAQVVNSKPSRSNP